MTYNRLKKGFVFGMIIVMFLATIVINVSTNVSAETPITDNHLQLYYSFDDISSRPITKDDSENGYDGTVNGANWVSTTNFGSAIKFDGKDYDYISIGDKPNLEILDELTIEAWIFWEGGDQIHTIAAHKGYFWFYIDGRSGGYTNKLVFESGHGESSNPWNGEVVSNDPIPEHQWTHVTVVRSDTNWVYLYINGYMKGQGGPYPPFDYTNTNTLIGAWSGTAHTFRGVLDEVKIFNEQLAPSDGLGICILKMGFEEGDYSGYTFDRSINNFVGTINGNPNIQSSGVYGSRCLDFDGINDNVEIPHSNKLYITKAVTFEAWIKAKGTSNYHCIVDKYDYNGGIPNGYSFYLGAGTIRLVIYSGTNGWEDAIGTTDLRDDAWHHVAGTFDGSEICVYVDGVQEGSHDWYYAAGPNSNNLGIGERLSDGTLDFKGKIDDLRIYNFAKQNIGSEVLRMPFEGSTWTERLMDKSTYGNDAIRISSPRDVTYSTDGKYIGALDFDGDDYIMVNDNPSLDLNGNSGFTIEAWIKADDCLDNYLTIVDKYHWLSACDSKGYTFLVSAGKIRLSIYSGSNCGDIVGTTELRGTGWHHVAGTFDGSTMRVYVDGILEKKQVYYHSPSLNNYNLYIGKRGNTGSMYYKGLIDNLIISNYAKTFHEDPDGDGMSDMYEIIRSIDSDQYNSIEHNGRYALLMCWSDFESILLGGVADSYWNDVTWTYRTLKSYGYNNCDIFVLNENDPPYISGKFDNIIDDIISESMVESYSFKINCWSKDSDFIYIHTSSHGKNGDGQDTPTPQASDDFTHTRIAGTIFDTENYWDYEFAEDIQHIQDYRTMVIINSFCYSGGFIDDLSESGRIIISSAPYCWPGYAITRPIHGSSTWISEMDYYFIAGLYYYEYYSSDSYCSADYDEFGIKNGVVSISEAWNYVHYLFPKCNAQSYIMYDDNGNYIAGYLDVEDEINCANKHGYPSSSEPFYRNPDSHSNDRFYWDAIFDDKHGWTVLNGAHIDGPGMNLPTKELFWDHYGDYLYDYSGNDYNGRGVSGWDEGRLGGKTYL